MKTPIILLSGKAGSGKDTVGNIITRKYNGKCTALADPMKRYAKIAFGFTDKALWGESKLRNEINKRFTHTMYQNGMFSEHSFFNEITNSTVPSDKSNWMIYFEKTTNSLDKKISARIVLQSLGEFGRTIDREIWIKHGYNTAFRILCDSDYTPQEGLKVSDRKYDYVIITDARYRNEILYGLQNNCFVIKINREADGSKEALNAGIKNHLSETEQDTVPSHFYTHIINNNGTLEETEKQIDKIFS